MQGNDAEHRALIVQLARLGDLMQSLPAITSLSAQMAATSFDLLCPSPFVSIGSCIPAIDRVLAWEVERWRMWADRWTSSHEATLAEIETYVRHIMPQPYGVSFNLNQHGRSILAATLFGHRVVGPGDAGALTRQLPPWADYLRGVARDRERNRIHLSDVFCGMCGVMPPGEAPRLRLSERTLPADLAPIGDGPGPWIAVAVGAGDAARCVPLRVWREWTAAVLQRSPTAQVILMGSGGEQELSSGIQDGLSPLCLSRVWDATGRTSVLETANLLSRCQWVVGSDTGPLHLGTAVGARAMGFFFARARVHETGPYGKGHWVWQANPPGRDKIGQAVGIERIPTWPVEASVRLILEGLCESADDGWTLWESHIDRWGAYYLEAGMTQGPDARREEVWRRLHQPKDVKSSFHEYV